MVGRMGASQIVLVTTGFSQRRIFKRLIAAFLCLLCLGCREPVIHNLSEADANRLLTKLQMMAVDSRKEREPDGKWLVSVPKKEMLRAMRYLDESRMLREIKPPQSAKSSMLVSREDQHFEFEQILGREIEYTLTSIENVLEARVHLKLPVRDPILGEQLQGGEGSASVLLIVGKEFSAGRDEIRDLVAGASGIKRDYVSMLISHPGSGAAGEGYKAGLAASLPAADKFTAPASDLTALEKQGDWLKRAADVAAQLPVEVLVSLAILGVAVMSWILSLWRKREKRVKHIAQIFEGAPFSGGTIA